ncbi:QF122 antigen [Plasmodium falciparum RAJ116]|uniref:QF122 antigen n=1 Tax=Plasmodium falciparum RAJ116 TaxID=580058 RepID=A0A0L0D0T8_PLAFA|nr:QF122 antigen [Plasmodium falciparum RAJ116]
MKVELMDNNNNNNNNNKNKNNNHNNDIISNINNNNNNHSDAKQDWKREIKLKEDERNPSENDLKKKFVKLNKADNYKNINDKKEAEIKKKIEIENFISTINSTISRFNGQTTTPINMKLSSADMENKCKDAKSKKKKINPKNLEEIEEANTYINYLEEQLSITKNYENFKHFPNRLISLRNICEEKLKENLKSMNETKIQEKKLRFVDTIIKMTKEKQKCRYNRSRYYTKKIMPYPLTHIIFLMKPYNFLNRIQTKYFVYVHNNKLSLTQ